MADQERRSFLRWAIHGMNAVVGALLGIPAIAYLIDARHRAAKPGNFRTVNGIRRGELIKDIPRQGVIRNVREDAWTLHPNDVVGRVWVVKTGEGPQDLRVWTTVCPHLGCSINVNPNPTTGFTCPCHNAEFSSAGARVQRPNYKNVAPREMDTLEWQLDPSDPDLIQVKYLNYYQGHHTKDPKA